MRSAGASSDEHGEDTEAIERDILDEPQQAVEFRLRPHRGIRRAPVVRTVNPGSSRNCAKTSSCAGLSPLAASV
jgi:hypothetical protein